MTRPDGLGDAYWDATKNEPKWADINANLTAHAEYTASVPKDADAIDWSLGNDPLDPEAPDMVYELNREDPRVQAIAPVLVAEGVSQKAISAIARAFAGVELAEHKTLLNNVRAEEAKLGDKHKERVDAVETGVAALLAGQNATEAQKQAATTKAKALRNQLYTADAVITLEELLRASAGPNPPPPVPPPPPGPDNIPADPAERARIWRDRGKQQS